MTDLIANGDPMDGVDPISRAAATDPVASIALIGFGEAAEAFFTGWALGAPSAVRAYDIRTEDPPTRPAMLDRYAAAGLQGCDRLAAALAEPDVVFSLVSADCALEAARMAAPFLRPGALWLDCNSCAPTTKTAAARVIDDAGARYVDVAVMAPVLPKRHHVPLLVSGPHAEAAMAVLQRLDMRPALAGDRIGQASSIKMLRSVMIKGMEALSAECFLAARRAGVEDRVIASLDASSTLTHWRAQAAYNLERMMVHGARRAAEMREVAATVAALGLPADMASATARWQDRIAAAGMGADPDGERDAEADILTARLDVVSVRL